MYSDSLLSKKLNANIPRLFFCCFLLMYIFINQYIYAVGDKRLLIDHDFYYYHYIFYHYLGNPLVALRECFLGRVHPDSSGWTNLLPGLSFYVFGRSLFVFKMAQALPLVFLCGAVYLLAYRLTGKELIAFLACVILIKMPMVVDLSRKFSPHLQLSVVCSVFMLFMMREFTFKRITGCLIPGLLIWIGFLVHQAALVYFLIMFVLLFRAKSGKLNYWIMFFLIVLIASGNSRGLMGWAGMVNPGLSADACVANAGGSMRGITQADFYSKICAAAGPYFVNIFLASLLILGIAWIIGRGRKSFLSSEVVFLLLFWLAAAAVFLLTRYSNQSLGESREFYCYIMVFVLLPVILTAILFGFIRNNIFKIRLLGFLYVSLCFGAVIWESVYKNNFFHYEKITGFPKSQHMISCMANDAWELSSDMADISYIFNILRYENQLKTGDDTLRILAAEVTAYSDKEGGTGLSYSRLIGSAGNWSFSSSVYVPQAFYSGVKVVWQPCVFYPCPGDLKDYFFMGFDPRGCCRKQNYINGLSFEPVISGCKYLFLTLLNETDNPWVAPEAGRVMDKINAARLNTPGMSSLKAKLFAVCRVQGNVFLYVFRL